MTLCTRELLKLHKHKFTESTAQCVCERSSAQLSSLGLPPFDTRALFAHGKVRSNREEEEKKMYKKRCDCQNNSTRYHRSSTILQVNVLASASAECACVRTLWNITQVVIRLWFSMKMWKIHSAKWNFSAMASARNTLHRIACHHITKWGE